MTKSTITRERLEALANAEYCKSNPGAWLLGLKEVNELARMALAAMEGESHTDDELSNLLWYSQEATCHSDPNYSCEFQRLATPGLVAGIILELQERRKAAMDGEPVAEVLSNLPGNDTSTIDRALPVGTQLYRHAQPAPVVNGEYGDAYQGAREDLAIWKRRALEAEESVRRLEQINDHLVKEAQGESRMGEPVIAQPAPVVQCVPLGDSPYDVPYSMPSNLREFIDQEIGILFSDDDAQGVWIACRRAAMLNGGKS